MAEVIITSFLSPAGFKQHVVKAKASVQSWGSYKSVIKNWNYDLDHHDNHRTTAELLATELGWAGDWISGTHRSECIFSRLPLNTVPDTILSFRVSHGKDVVVYKDKEMPFYCGMRHR